MKINKLAWSDPNSDSEVRAKISYHLSHEFGVSRAEIARQLGVCTSAIAKAIQNMEGVRVKC